MSERYLANENFLAGVVQWLIGRVSMSPPNLPRKNAKDAKKGQSEHGITIIFKGGDYRGERGY
jgi:hypothetical protein